MKRVNMVLVACVLVVFASVNAQIVLNQSNLGMIANVPNTAYIIASDIYCDFDHQSFLVIDADSVIVDNPYGYKVVGYDKNAGNCISIKTSYVTIKNLIISNFHRGIFHSGVYGADSELVIINNTITDCGQSGVELYNVSNSFISGNNINRVGFYTIYLSGGENNTVIDLASTGVISENNFVGNFHLSQNYPNPFNPSTTLAYTLPRAMNVRLVIYDIAGQVVEEMNGFVSAGEHTYTWQAQDLPAGTYFYKLQAGENVETKKMILSK